MLGLSMWGFGIAHVAKMVVLVAAIVAVACVALRVFGITIPEWVVRIFWIIVVAFVAIAAIELLAGM